MKKLIIPLMLAALTCAAETVSVTEPDLRYKEKDSGIVLTVDPQVELMKRLVFSF